MPRLAPITTIEQVPAGGEADFQAVVGSRGRINAPQSMIMYSPAVSSHATALNDVLRKEMSSRDYEVAVLVTAREFPIEFVWSAHVPAARRAGISDDVIEAIRSGGPLSAASRRDAIIIQLGRELIGQRRLSQETFDAAREELGEKLLIEAMMTMGNYLMIGCVLIGTAMEPVGEAPPLSNVPL
jgi:4-carboxymuconolactone decarboxylase